MIPIVVAPPALRRRCAGGSPCPSQRGADVLDLVLDAGATPAEAVRSLAYGFVEHQALYGRDPDDQLRAARGGAGTGGGTSSRSTGIDPAARDRSPSAVAVTGAGRRGQCRDRHCLRA